MLQLRPKFDTHRFIHLNTHLVPKFEGDNSQSGLLLDGTLFKLHENMMERIWGLNEVEVCVNKLCLLNFQSGFFFFSVFHTFRVCCG